MMRLNRPIEITTPDASIIQPIYNEASLLEQLGVNVQGTGMATPFVTNIDYNAKGQRTLIQYGNGAGTSYEYDPDTFRLAKLKTTRSSDNAVLQDLRYTYDPIGNVTQFEDNAQQTIYFNNAVVAPNCNYTYDAVYRLISAAGREHIGQVADPQPEYDWNDFPRVNLPNPNDGSSMRQYQEQYNYDNVGNILQTVHQATGGSWTRNYAYASSSNQLQGTSLPGDAALGPYSARYSYDLNGGMIQMLHLPTINWDFKEQLFSTQQQAVNDGTGETTYYVYDSAGMRTRKVTESANGVKTKERIYLGGIEVYREYTGSYAGLERQTLHVMDDKRRVAMIETRNDVDDGTAPNLTRFQFSNNLGSAFLELDASAQAHVISYEEYYPYGGTSYQAMNQAIKAAAKRYRYTGKERDEESGFYYHGARYYAPWLGRWTSCDPKGMVDGANLYRYVRDNPVKLRDPNGTNPWTMEHDPIHAPLIKKYREERGLPANGVDQFGNQIGPTDAEIKYGGLLAEPSGDSQLTGAAQSHAAQTSSQPNSPVSQPGGHPQTTPGPKNDSNLPAQPVPPVVQTASPESNNGSIFYDSYVFGGTTWNPGKPLSLSLTISDRIAGYYTGGRLTVKLRIHYADHHGRHRCPSCRFACHRSDRFFNEYTQA